MKYAITGHTNGIGKKIFERLYPNILGFSRSNGYDIDKIEDRKRIIDESIDCDIFINNAHSGFGQTYLFLELLSEWQNKEDKTIINVGSRIAEINLPSNYYHLFQYQAEKIILKEMSKKVISKCSIKYTWFGYVGTEKILKKYPHFTKNDYITEDEAANIILSC